MSERGTNEGRPALIEALEPRVLLSADLPGAVFVDAMSAGSLPSAVEGVVYGPIFERPAEHPPLLGAPAAPELIGTEIDPLLADETPQPDGDATPTGDSFILYEQFGGTWHDVEKTPQNDDDDLMCWAAATSNVLAWTGWGLVDGISTTDEMFSHFCGHWTDEGGNSYYGTDWWFDGTYDGPTTSGWSVPDVAGGGGFYPGESITDYRYWSSDDASALSTIDTYLRAERGVTISVRGPGGHAITCWGVNYNPSDPSDYYGVWVTDSDDDKGYTSPPDRLRYYEVSLSGGKWYLQDYYGSDAWYIGEVLGLDRNPNTSIVVDNADDGFSTTGSWGESGVSDEYNGSSLATTEIGATATWTADITVAGSYDVHVWYASQVTNRDSQADYTVSHGYGSTDVEVDQDDNSGQWVLLGTVYLPVGSASVTVIHDDEDSHATSADAMKWTKVDTWTGGEQIVDNLDDGFSYVGVWRESGVTDEYASSSLNTNADGATATWQVELHQDGLHEVWAWWAAETSGGYTDRDSAVGFEIDHTGGPTTLTYDQDLNSGEWVRLGTYSFSAGSTSVTMTTSSDDRAASADAIKWVRVSEAAAVETIVDNADRSFAYTGRWFESGVLDEYDGSSLVTNQSGATASFSANLPETDTYDVFVWWAAAGPDNTYTDRDSAVQLSINGGSTRTYDQDIQSGQWVYAGNHSLTRGVNTVSLTVSGDVRPASADAVKFVQADASEQTLIVDNLDAGFSYTGRWAESGASYEHNGSSICTNSAGSTATWRVNLPATGWYEVTAAWTGYGVTDQWSTRDEAVEFTVYHAGGTTTITVNQNYVLDRLGWFQFNAGVGKVEMTVSDDVRPASADTITFAMTDSVPTTHVQTCDNEDLGFSFVGVWSESGATDVFDGTPSDCSNDAGAVATWATNIYEAGDYDIKAWWANEGDALNRDSAADYVIEHAYGTDIVTVDQDVNGGQWVALGTYHLEPGPAVVKLRPSADVHPAVADGIAWDLAGNTASVEVIVDNLYVGFSTTGGWGSSGATDPYNRSSYATTNVGAEATFAASLPQAGSYEVYAWWSADSSGGTLDRDSQADYTVNHNAGADTVTVDQDLNSGQWVLLGTYDFDAGAASVTLTHDDEDGQPTVADAVKFAYAGPAGATGLHTPAQTPEFDLLAEATFPQAA